MRESPVQDYRFAIGDIEFNRLSEKYLHISFLHEDLHELIGHRMLAHSSHPSNVYIVDMNAVQRLAITYGMCRGKRDMVKVVNLVGKYFDISCADNVTPLAAPN